MAFTAPRIKSRLIKFVVKNALRILERDIGGALAWIASQDSATALPVFAEYVNSPRRIYTLFPVAIVEPGESDLAEEEALIEGHTLDVEIAVTGEDPQQLTLDLCDYIAAMDMVWRTVNPAEFVQDIPTDAQSTPIVRITNHAYGALADSDDGTMYLRRARMTLLVGFTEDPGTY